MNHKTKREVSPEELKVLDYAQSIADKWVTPMRLTHVLDMLPEKGKTRYLPLVIGAISEVIKKESEGKVVWSKAVDKAIGRKAMIMYRNAINEPQVMGRIEEQ